VRDLCERLTVPNKIIAIDVAKRAADRGIGIEEAARDARYEVLKDIALPDHCPFVAVAHTADDQVETILHHVLRGTGLAGLRGMPRERELTDGVRLVRPLLDVRRNEIERFLKEIGQVFRQDRTNDDVSLTRNFLRRELLPLLERRINSRVREHLLQLAEQAAECEESILIAAEQLLMTALLDQSTTCVRLRCDLLASASRHLVRELFVRVWHNQQWPRQLMTFSHWNALAAMARTGEPHSVNLPGGLIGRRRGQLIAIECLDSHR
jgi:tRNA(Ile)-lysidine synthase